VLYGSCVYLSLLSTEMVPRHLISLLDPFFLLGARLRRFRSPRRTRNKIMDLLKRYGHRVLHEVVLFSRKSKRDV